MEALETKTIRFECEPIYMFSGFKINKTHAVISFLRSNSVYFEYKVEESYDPLDRGSGKSYVTIYAKTIQFAYIGNEVPTALEGYHRTLSQLAERLIGYKNLLGPQSAVYNFRKKVSEEITKIKDEMNNLTAYDLNYALNRGYVPQTYTSNKCTLNSINGLTLFEDAGEYEKINKQNKKKKLIV